MTRLRPLDEGGTNPSLGDDRDGFDFDQPVGTDKCRDTNERAGWRMLGPDVTAADFADDRDVLRLESHDEQAGLHDVAKRRTDRRQRERDVVEGLLGLRFEVASADNLASLVDPDLPRNVNRLAAGRADDVSPTKRRTQLRRIEELDVHVESLLTKVAALRRR